MLQEMIMPTKRNTTIFPIAILLATCVWGNATNANAAILSRLDRGESLTISAIGTSLTAADCSTWFGQMGAWLNTKYPGKVTLDNEAISGSASSHTPWYSSDCSGLGVQLPAALKHNPDAIFIEFAINDASVDVGISPELSKQNLQTMINQINAWAAQQNKTVDIVIQTMSNDPLSGLRPNLVTYEEGYRQVAKANGLLLIDHYPTWVNLYNNDPATWLNYVPDHVHPGPLGTQNIILPEIQQSLGGQVPEPTSAILLLTGLLGLLACTWRKWKGLINHAS